jgi:hypothetical protein
MSHTGKKILVFVGIALICFLIVVAIVDAVSPKKFCANYMNLHKASIMEKQHDPDENRYHIRVYVPGRDIPSDHLWVEVRKEFYDKHRLGDDIGVLLGNYDVFKAKRQFLLFGRKVYEYDENFWGIENVYDTYNDGMAANPYSKFKMKAVLKEKKTGRSGQLYFVFDCEGKPVKAAVGREMFDKCREGQTFDGQFETLGNFTRFVGFTASP